MLPSRVVWLYLYVLQSEPEQSGGRDERQWRRWRVGRFRQLRHSGMAAACCLACCLIYRPWTFSDVPRQTLALIQVIKHHYCLPLTSSTVAARNQLVLCNLISSLWLRCCSWRVLYGVAVFVTCALRHCCVSNRSDSGMDFTLSWIQFTLRSAWSKPQSANTAVFLIFTLIRSSKKQTVFLGIALV